ESLQVHLRKALFQAGDQVEKILERQVRMQAADDVELGDCLAVAGGSRLKCFFECHRVRAGSISLSTECAQPARSHTHVRRIDVPVYVEVSFMAMHPLANMVRQPAHGKNVTGTVER